MCMVNISLKHSSVVYKEKDRKLPKSLEKLMHAFEPYLNNIV